MDRNDTTFGVRQACDCEHRDNNGMPHNKSRRVCREVYVAHGPMIPTEVRMRPFKCRHGMVVGLAAPTFHNNSQWGAHNPRTVYTIRVFHKLPPHSMPPSVASCGKQQNSESERQKKRMHMGKRRCGHHFGMPIQVIGTSCNLTEGTYSARAALSRAGSESFDTATAI